MDPISMSMSTYMDMMLLRSKSMQGNVLLSLMEVVERAERSQAKPLGNIAAGSIIDVYA